MRNTAKRIAAMVAALMMTATGTVCFGANAGPNIGSNANNRNDVEWEHRRFPVHLADTSQPVDPFRYDYDYNNKKEAEAHFNNYNKKMDELKSEWGALLEATGYSLDELRYGGDIKIPLGGKVTVHFGQFTYSLYADEGESNLDQYIDQPTASVEQLGRIVNLNVLPIIKYESSRAYCRPYEFTGLQNGTTCLVYQTNSVEASFYRIIVGNGKNEGGTQAPAAQQQAAASQAPASWTAGTL